MAVKVYPSSTAGDRELTYSEADAFSVTSSGFLLIQRKHSGIQLDLAVFAPGAWLHAELLQERHPGSR